MREGWEYKKLGEVALSSDLGKTLNQSKDIGTMRPYLCAVNILWDKIDLSILKETRFEDSELERYTVSKGDLLICEGGDTGRAAIWDREDTILYQNALHRVRFTKDINTRFVLFYLRHLKNIGEIDHRYSKGVTIKHLVKSSLMSIPIPFPSLSIQQSIVSELDEINNLLSLKRKELETYDKLAQSLFYEMFGDPVENEKGWEVKKLGDIAIYPNKRIQMSVISAQEYVGVENLIKNRGGVQFSEKLPNADTATEFQMDDILIGNIRPYLKKIWKADKYGGASGDVIIIRIADTFKEKLYPLYLYKTLSTDTFFDYNNANTHGAKMPRGDKKAIAKYSIPIPPLPLQQLFASRIEAIEAQKVHVKAAIEKLERLLAARMQYWFD